LRLVVNAALQLKHVSKIITLGPCSRDWSGLNSKVEISARSPPESSCFCHGDMRPRASGDRSPTARGHRREHGHLFWRKPGRRQHRRQCCIRPEQIDTEAIWLTIDKDVLPESEALTNWDQGQMPLRALLDLIGGIGAHKRIAGADICGEFSLPALCNPLKRIESRIDRPQRRADAVQLARNETVNRELLGAIRRAAA
jgi:hypothetical protein